MRLVETSLDNEEPTLSKDEVHELLPILQQWVGEKGWEDVLGFILKQMETTYLQANTRPTQVEAVTLMKNAYGRCLEKVCEVAGIPDLDEGECIFDVDRPVSEWRLKENKDLLEKRIDPPG